MASTRGVGKHEFVRKHNLLSPAQDEAVQRSVSLIEQHDLRTIRFIWVDQHGAPRCKFMSAPDYLASLENGIDFSAALFSMDTRDTPLVNLAGAWWLIFGFIILGMALLFAYFKRKNWF